MNYPNPDAVEPHGVPTDRLLRVVRLALVAAQGLCVFTATGALVAIAIMFVTRDRFIARLAEHRIEASSIGWIALLLLLAATMVVLGFFVLRHLRRIVDSVAHGEPFVPVNADRLNHMAWLVLAIQLLAVPMTLLALWFDSAPVKPNVHHGSEGISIGALLLALILFILARVFRIGAEMRDELEGTV